MGPCTGAWGCSPAALMQQRTAAACTLPGGSAETIGETRTGLDLRGCTDTQFASASAPLGELHPSLHLHAHAHSPLFLSTNTPPLLLFFFFSYRDCGSFNEQSWLMQTNPDLTNNLFGQLEQ